MEPKVYEMPDTPETYKNMPDAELLKLSLEKWQTILEKLEEGYEVTNHQAYSCPLCRQYLLESGCEGCPIERDTSEHSCQGTPYGDNHLDIHTLTEDDIEAVKEEITYLEYLYEQYKEPEPEPSEPKLEIPVTDFGGNKITLSVRGGAGHDHVYILKDGVPVAYMHIIPGHSYPGGYRVNVFASDKEFFEHEPPALATPVQKTKQQPPEVLGTITCTLCKETNPTYEITDPKLVDFLADHDSALKITLPGRRRVDLHYKRE